MGDGSQPGEGSGELFGPWPVGGETKRDASGPVDEPSGDGDVLGADGSRNGEPPAAGGVTEMGGPADQVVGEDDAGEPGAVR